jgi:hypothetical protein
MTVTCITAQLTVFGYGQRLPKMSQVCSVPDISQIGTQNSYAIPFGFNNVPEHTTSLATPLHAQYVMHL